MIIIFPLLSTLTKIIICQKKKYTQSSHYPPSKYTQKSTSTSSQKYQPYSSKVPQYKIVGGESCGLISSLVRTGGNPQGLIPSLVRTGDNKYYKKKIFQV